MDTNLGMVRRWPPERRDRHPSGLCRRPPTTPAHRTSGLYPEDLLSTQVYLEAAEGDRETLLSPRKSTTKDRCLAAGAGGSDTDVTCASPLFQNRCVVEVLSSTWTHFPSNPIENHGSIF